MMWDDQDSRKSWDRLGGWSLHSRDEFSFEYPSKPPKYSFKPPLLHRNVYPSGRICLSILNEEEGWSPAIMIKEVLLGIRDLLDYPNLNSPAQSEAFQLYQSNKAAYYKARVKSEAKKFTPTHDS